MTEPTTPTETPVVILAGGLGTRLREETEVRPKPMVEIGGRPILWHIMKIYAALRLRRVRAARSATRATCIKDVLPQLLRPCTATSRSTLGRVGAIEVHDEPAGATGACTWSTPAWTRMTGGRVRRARAASSTTARFMVTYGDGVADVDIDALLALPRAPRPARHRHGRAAARALRRPRLRRRPRASSSPRSRRPARAGSTAASSSSSPQCSTTSRRRHASWSASRWSAWRADGQLMAYRHEGFWQPMDTLRD